MRWKRVVPHGVILGVLSVAAGCGGSGSSGSAAPATGTDPVERVSSAPPASASTTSTGPVTPAQRYASNCAGCHGVQGEGGMAPALIGVADRLSRDEEIEVVTNGRGTMLSFGSSLTPEQIAEVVDYTRTLAGTG